MSVETSHAPTYKGLQVLRIVAAGLVVTLHSTFYAHERLNPNISLFGVGVTGVDIFFVLSGFVMVYSSGRLVSARDGWKVFAERRISRIVPLYWIATTLKLALLFLTAGLIRHSQFNLWQTFCSYSFIPAYNVDHEIEPLLGVGWTLNFEMFFYVIFAISLFLRVNVYRFCGVVLSALALGSHYHRPGSSAISFYATSMVIEFFFGMLIAKACLLRWHLPRWWAALVLAGAFVWMLNRLPPVDSPRGLTVGIPAALIVYGTASLESIFSRVPGWLVYLGDASYAIYLFHPMCSPGAPALLSKMHVNSGFLAVILSLVIATFVGCIVHAYVETPINVLLRDRVRVRHERILRYPR